MRVAFWLPRHNSSVAVARQVLDGIFKQFGVRAECREQIALAVSEACSNAVRHAGGQEGYQLCAEAEDSQCVIEVIDGGPGIAAPAKARMPPATQEGGRGLAIMRFTTDSVELRRRRPRGLAVRMSKALQFESGAIVGPA